jgi:hypothetical protein
VPTEPRAVAKFEQAASVEYAQFDPIASVIAYEKVFKPRYGQQTNESLVTELVARLEIKLDGYEAILSKQKYLAGDVRHARTVSQDDVVLMDSYSCRSLPSQISSTCRTASLSLTISSWRSR